MSSADIFPDLNRSALAATARTEIVRRSFDRSRTMILRELHIHERKSAVACVDARDKSVMGYIRFSSASLKDSCLNARGKIESWQQCWQQLAAFEGKFFGFFKWWSRWDSNPRPPRCHRGALPTAPRPHRAETTESILHNHKVRVHEEWLV